MTLFALLSVLVTSGSQAVYGTPIWDPIALAAKMDNTVGILFALLTVLIATLSVNIAANVVSPAYGLANLLPKWVTFRTGALITGVRIVIVEADLRPARLHLHLARRRWRPPRRRRLLRRPLPH